MTEKLLTKEQLAEALGLQVHTVQTLTRKKRIPVLRLGYRTRRYLLSKVLKALEG